MTTDDRAAYARLLAAPSTVDAGRAERWMRAAQALGEAADELRRLHRLLAGHWRAGSGQQDTDEMVRRLVRQLDEAHDAYTRIAGAITGRDDDLTRARGLALAAAADARLAGLVVNAEGEVASEAVTPPMAVRAVASRLTARIAEATAQAEVAERRASEAYADIPPPHPR
ncbi:hypothetical protein ACQPZK_09480 [Micromonospora sp. CA-249363]|uniref:hypothetical protein n=1 Tax=Micromonospora sp. CA-249363 TaxID=3239963 RepID=UPI003D9050C0